VCEGAAALRLTGDGGNWTVRGHEVDYCLSQRVPEVCEFCFNIWIMVMVIVFVTLAAAVMLYMSWRVLKREDDALRTMGDAVASFLEREDGNTRGMCLVSKAEVEKQWKEEYDPVMFEGKRRVRWIAASSRKEWWSIFAT
jgi:hypothetical protein